ncbi:MAG: glycosyltransferase [Bacteroidales bacterium]
MNNVLNFIVHIFEHLYVFATNMTLVEVINTYWYLFFIEVPRYYILDIIVLLHRRLQKKYRDARRAYARQMLFIENPLVTILVPGKNEGKYIYSLVHSLQEQTYKNFQLIVVDDGSTDWTPMIGKDLEKAGYIDKFLRSEIRGGKASAANFGLQYAQGKYIVHVDADSSLDRNSIENILIPFYFNKKIKGVGGCVKVRNSRENLCTSLQAVEYLETIMVGRTVTSELGIYRIISGAFGAFETNTLKQVGGWDVGPGLDGDITQKIRKSQNRVYFATDAVCMTNVPTKFYALAKQRMRWSKSLVRFRLRKHRDIFTPNKNFSMLNFLSGVENFFFDFFFDFMWLAYIINLIVSNQNFIVEIFLLKYLLITTLRYCSFGVAMMITERRKEEYTLVKFVPLGSLYSGLFLRIIRIIGHIRELFFFSSYKDPWNPKKTSDAARMENL